MTDKSHSSQLSLFEPPEGSKISSIIKRDGRVAPFDRMRIANAIFKAAVSVGGKDKALAETLADKVINRMNRLYPAGATPSVEEIQDLAEKVLMDNGHAKTAKSFILYRAERQKVRSKKEEKIVVEDTVPYKTLWKVFTWNVDHGCYTLEGLNRHLKNRTWPKLILEAEKAYQSDIDRAAAMVMKRLGDLRLLIVAGPSSSGKTTTTSKIGEKLKAKGADFLLLNLDNYFKNLDQHPKDEYGDHDFEPPQALDLELINEHLARLLKGEAVETPVYNFKTGRRETTTRPFRLLPKQLILIDSLHGLYEPMTRSVPKEMKFKLYIEALCQIKDGRGEFVRWADLRMLRRMVRDSWHRSYDPLRTIGHWHYVRRSEMKHIVPFINSVDFIFNGALPYELPYHKKRLFSHVAKAAAQFQGDPKKLDALIRAQRVHDLLKNLQEPKDDADVPGNSLLREFIGGSVYTY